MLYYIILYIYVLYLLSRAPLMSSGQDETRVSGYIYIYIYINTFYFLGLSHILKYFDMFIFINSFIYMLYMYIYIYIYIIYT